jgi:hypothetical protein
VFSTVGGDVIQAEDTYRSGTAELVVPADFSYLRRGAGVRLESDGSLWFGTDSSASQGRNAYVRVRYGSVEHPTDLVLTVNRRDYRVPLRLLPRVNGADAAFTEARFEVKLRSGGNDLFLRPESAVAGASVVIDDITISTEYHEGLAEAHTVFGTLTRRRQGMLLDFLLQLDRGANRAIEESGGKLSMP